MGKDIVIDTENPGTGWTIRYCVPIAHPSNGQWAYVLDQKIIDDSTDPDFTQNLTSGELTTLQNEITNKVTLDSTWFPEV